MFNKYFLNIKDFELQNNSNSLSSFADRLIEKYKKSAQKHVYKKDLLISIIINLLGNLFSRTYAYREDKKKGASEKINFILVSHKAEMYCNRKHEDFTNNIEMIQATYKLMLTAEDILTHFNIIVIETHNRHIEKDNGQRYKIDDSGNIVWQTTKIRLKNICEWKCDFIFDQDIHYNLKFASLMNGELNRFFKGNKKYPNDLSAYIKKKLNDKETKVKAPYDYIEEVRKVNYLFPESIRSQCKYKRAFSENLNSGGRLYGLINQMTKDQRLVLILRPFNYVEVDFTALIPNTIKYYVSGAFYTSRPYNIVAKTIIEDKIRSNKGKVIVTNEEIVNIVAKAIKQPILMLFNGDTGNQRTITAIQYSLAENGLDNFPDEVEDVKNQILIKKNDSDRYKKATLYRLGKKRPRWKQFLQNNDFPDYDLDYFITPKNIYDGISRALPELRPFLLTENWNWTQLIESNTILKIVEYIKEDNLLPLIVHDCIIVPKEYEQKYADIMEKELINQIELFKDKNITEAEAKYRETIWKFLEYSEKIGKLRIIDETIQINIEDNDEDVEILANIKGLNKELYKFVILFIREYIKVYKNSKITDSQIIKNSKFYSYITTKNYWSLYHSIKEILQEYLHKMIEKRRRFNERKII